MDRQTEAIALPDLLIWSVDMPRADLIINSGWIELHNVRFSISQAFNAYKQLKQTTAALPRNRPINHHFNVNFLLPPIELFCISF